MPAVTTTESTVGVTYCAQCYTCYLTFGPNNEQQVAICTSINRTGFACGGRLETVRKSDLKTFLEDAASTIGLLQSEL